MVLLVSAVIEMVPHTYIDCSWIATYTVRMCTCVYGSGCIRGIGWRQPVVTSVLATTDGWEWSIVVAC